MLEIRIDSAFHIHGRGTVLAGPVVAGTVAIGDTVEVRSARAAVRAVVAGLESQKQIIAEASAGTEVAVLLRDFSPERIPDGMQRQESGSWQVASLRIVSPPKRWWQFW
jgi:translation elongation factor EF-Tu-like GTPase